MATLVADTKQWQSGLATAKADLSAFAKTAVTSLAGVAASFGAMDFAKTSILAAESDIAATAKLEAVLQSMGGVAGVTSIEISELAGDLQRLTNFEDDATVGAAAVLATFKNLRGEDFKQAVALAQDMATVLEIDVLSAAKRIGKEIKDLSVDDAGEKIDELAERFGGAAESAQTSTKALELAWGDLQEQIGKTLLPATELLTNTIIPAMYRVGEALNNISDGAATAGDSLIANLFSPALTALAQLNPMLDWFNGQDAPLPATADTKEEPEPEPEPEVGGELLFAESSDNSEQIQEDFDKQLRDLDRQLALARGEITRGEAAAAELMDQGAFTDDEAEQLRQRIDALDALKNAEKGIDEPKPGEKPDTQDKGFAALQKGSAEAMSAVFTAMRGKDDKQLQAAEENNVQNDEMIALLREVRDGMDGEVILVAGSVV